MEADATPPPVPEPHLFSFVGPDAYSALLACLCLAAAGVLAFELLDYSGCAAWTALALGIVCFAAGLRNRIVVTSEHVVVTRLWLFIPSWRQTGPAIEDVWYSGDWGEPEGASSVSVVCKGGKEFQVGSPGTMHALHDALMALTPSATEYQRSLAADDSGEPRTF